MITQVITCDRCGREIDERRRFLLRRDSTEDEEAEMGLEVIDIELGDLCHECECVVIEAARNV
jgi:hypothetical protein